MLAGQTPGKRLMGVRVVRADGERLRFGNALRRELAHVISGILFLSYLWILFNNRRRGSTTSWPAPSRSIHGLKDSCKAPWSAIGYSASCGSARRHRARRAPRERSVGSLAGKKPGMRK
jgi:uncharacterized RDD family membrane protein YckC